MYLVIVGQPLIFRVDMTMLVILRFSDYVSDS